MSKSSELDKKVKQYLINSIDLSGYDMEDSIENLEKVFLVEYGWAIERYGKVGAIKEWLQGLPSAIDIPFYHYDILQLSKDWGSLPEKVSERQEDKILDNWYNFMANKLEQLFSGYRVPEVEE